MENDIKCHPQWQLVNLASNTAIAPPVPATDPSKLAVDLIGLLSLRSNLSIMLLAVGFTP
jgi:hypothetical protein